MKHDGQPSEILFHEILDVQKILVDGTMYFFLALKFGRNSLKKPCTFCFLAGPATELNNNQRQRISLHGVVRILIFARGGTNSYLCTGWHGSSTLNRVVRIFFFPKGRKAFLCTSQGVAGIFYIAWGGNNIHLCTEWQGSSTLPRVTGITSSSCHRSPTLLVTTFLQSSTALFYIFTALQLCLSALQIVSTIPSTLLRCQHCPGYKLTALFYLLFFNVSTALSAREEGGDHLVQETDD